jgi:hypothetical protein
MKRSLFVVALSALLIIGAGSQSLVEVDAYAARPNVVAPQGGVTYKFKDAGLQFNVSAGWEIEGGSNGVTFSKIENETSFVIASISLLDPVPASVTLETQFKAAWEGATKASKDFKKVGEPNKGTQGGMPVISQGYTATLQGLQMIGVLAVIKAAKPTLIFIYGTAKTSDEFNKDFDNLLDSMKKIE